jgi:hypothetical protein
MPQTDTVQQVDLPDRSEAIARWLRLLDVIGQFQAPSGVAADYLRLAQPKRSGDFVLSLTDP